MFVQKLPWEERYRAHQVQAVAFEGCFDLQKAKEEAGQPPAPEAWPVTTWAAMSDDRKMVYGCMDVTSYLVYFDGHQVRMGGIGGVATLPPYRRQGAIRACMEAAFAGMYEEGMAFSSLYPFSTAFYRQFGFENGARLYDWTLPLEGLPPVGPDGRVEQLFPGDDLSPLLEVYRQVYGGCNLSVLRKTYDAALEKDNFLNQQRYIFLWRDEAGAARGFFISHKEREPEGVVMNCRTDFPMRNGFLFADAQALQGLLSFARAFRADYQYIRFAAGEGVPVTALVPEANSAQCRVRHNGMLRVINVKKALSLCKCVGEGQLRISLQDGMFPENTGTWQLEFAPGKPNRVSRTELPGDIALPVGTFSALLCGVRREEELPWMPDVRISNPHAPIGQVFYAKPCRVLDLF